MEPVTHILTGACLARAGCNRRAAYATAAMAVAAEFPDIDTLWGLKGPIEGFQHHRGITHTFLGIPFEAAFLLGVVWLCHSWRHRPAALGRPNPPKAPATPVRWASLYAFLLLALLSHILLDYTNNYGVRPFFPFNAHWYAASIVFIFDPLLFLFLLAGLLLPALFGLIGQEIGARREPFRGAGWARVALFAVLILWLARFYEHSLAIDLANQQSFEAVTPGSLHGADAPASAPASLDPAISLPEEHRAVLTPRQALASPDPLSLFRWYTAIDYGPAYQLGTANTHVGALTVTQTLNKPEPNRFSQAASQSRLGRVYLDWSTMPWITSGDPANSTVGDAFLDNLDTAQGGIEVTFQDFRFLGTAPMLSRGSSPPLTGTVILNRAGQILAQGMGKSFEH